MCQVLKSSKKKYEIPFLGDENYVFLLISFIVNNNNKIQSKRLKIENEVSLRGEKKTLTAYGVTFIR